MSKIEKLICPSAHKCPSTTCGHRMPHTRKDKRPRHNHPEGISPCDTSYCTRFEDIGTCEPVVKEDTGYYNRGFDRGLAYMRKERDVAVRRLETAEKNASADKAEAWDEGYVAGKTSYQQGYNDAINELHDERKEIIRERDIAREQRTIAIKERDELKQDNNRAYCRGWSDGYKVGKQFNEL